MCSTRPFSRRRSSSVRSLAVSTSTGMSRQSECRRSASTNSNPSISGIIRSRMMTSGCASASCSRATLPFSACPTLQPSFSSASLTPRRAMSSSSTRSTRRPDAPQIFRSVPISWLRSTGLTRNSVAPSAKPRPFSSTIVMRITGMSESAGSPLITDSTDQPSRSGIITSSVIAAGLSSRASRSPSTPPSAVTTMKPSRTRKRSVTARTVGSSSTTRITGASIGAAGDDGPGRAVCCAAMGSPAPTCAGRRMVKVDPWPGSLSTAISPPIIWQKRRLMASPSPVPPYLRVVDASAWTKS